MRSIVPGAGCRQRCSSSARLRPSARWASSTATRIGRSTPTSARARATASASEGRTASAGARYRSPNSGTSRAIAASTAGGAPAMPGALARAGSRWRRVDQSLPCSASKARVLKTSASSPDWRVQLQKSESSLVRPLPSSPSTRTTPPPPRDTCRHRADSTENSVARATMGRVNNASRSADPIA